MADAHPHSASYPTDRLVGTAPAIAALRAQVRHLATFDSVGNPHVPTVLLQGETGTGKGLVARVIHDSGPRAKGPFIEVNCAAIPETMLEAELFGFEPGAFTDAKRAKPGLFEAASGGTLFLDEIDALPLVLQGKLLTALEAKRVRRLGAVTERRVDVKLIAATNAILPEVVATGRFRADLYHRLAVVVLGLPPLRERGTDIVALAEAFVQHYAAAHGMPHKRLSAEAEAWLQGYAWPGNVRELSHVMERVTLLHIGEEIDAKTLMQLCQPLTAPQVSGKTAPAAEELIAERALPAEAEQIRQALVQTGGNVAQAARLLGVSRDTVRYRMQRYGIERPRLWAASPATSPLSPGTGTRQSSPESEGLSAASALPFVPSRSWVEKNRLQELATRQDARRDTATARNISTPVTTWEQKPVVVLALEVTWPEVSALEPLPYDLWTEMARWEQTIISKVHGFGGTLVQHAASRLVWVFGVPQTLEQLPQRAVHAALAIRHTATAATTPERPPGPEVRLAVHLGGIRVDSQAADPTAYVLAMGETLALPVRLLGQAAAGEIVISPEVGRLIEGWVALEERSLQLHAGDPIRLGGYAVVGVRPERLPSPVHRRVPRSPWVGRERELTLLDAILAQVKAGRGQVVSLVGAPGMGKSRLLAEFRQHLAGQRVRYAEGHCLAYGSGTPYLPVLDLLRDHCGLAVEDPPETCISQLRGSLEQAQLDVEASLPLLLDLLGLPVEADPLGDLSPEARKARTFEAMRQLFMANSQDHPVVLAVENLHWIDPTSEALLASLVDGLAGAAILVLATFRPGYRPLWLDKSYATQVALQPLGPDESRQVVRHVVRDTALPPALEQQLLARAEGNPFFLEELAYTVREHREGNAPLAVPDSIQAVLAARMERLPTPERQLLQAAAVLGKDIAVPLLQAIAERPEAALQRGLAHLQAAEFLYQTRLWPERVYTFRHVLTQEVAYQSLLQRTREHYHQQIAQVVEERLPEIAATQPEWVAHHYTAAGLMAQAIPYWQRAGQQALQRSASLEAVQHLTKGLELLAMLPEAPAQAQQELDLQMALGPALMATRGWGAPEVEQTYVRARALCEQVGETPQLFPTLLGLCAFYRSQGTLSMARELGEQLDRLAQRAATRTHRLAAHDTLGMTLFYLGDYAAARAHLEQGIALTDPTTQRALAHQSGVAPGISCLAYAANTLWCLGYPAQAVRRSQEALALAEVLAHPYSLAFAQHWAASLHYRRREALAVQEQADALLTMATAQGFPTYMGHGTCWQGWALATQGQGEVGIAQMRQGLAAFMATGQEMSRPLHLVRLAEAVGHTGQVEEGLRLLSEALASLETSARGDWLAEAYRLRGELLLRQATPDAAQAEACFQQALTIARRQQAKSWELRAAMSLSRLWQCQGRRAKAYELLTPIYGWFTEGFETADLQEAKALLEELS